MLKEYRIIKSISNRCMSVQHIDGVHCNDFALIFTDDGKKILGQVSSIEYDRIHLQLFDNAIGLKSSCKMRFLKADEMLPLTEDALGRVLNGFGQPMDGQMPLLAEKHTSFFGTPLNPLAREIQPLGILKTSLKAIDGFCPIAKGHKTSVIGFNQEALYDVASKLIAGIMQNENDSKLKIVIAMIGSSESNKSYLINELDKAGISDKTAIFYARADSNAFEKVCAARSAATYAQYLSQEKNMDVVFIALDAQQYIFAGEMLAHESDKLFDKATHLFKLYDASGKLRSQGGTISLISMYALDEKNTIEQISQASDSMIFLSKQLYQSVNSLPIDVIQSHSSLASFKPDQNRAELSHKLRQKYSNAIKVQENLKMLGEGALSKNEIEQLDFLNNFESIFNDNTSYSQEDILPILLLARQEK